MIVIVVNMPAPYRNPVYKAIAEKVGFHNFHVIFCAIKEPNRDWVTDQSGFSYSYLKENVIETSGKYIHNNLDIFAQLNHLNPDVVITCGFNPTHLYAFLWVCIHKKKHIAWSDGTLDSEKKLSFFHHLIRRIVYFRSCSFIGASQGTWRLYESYGVDKSHYYQSHLCVNNDAFTVKCMPHRQYDFMFSGRFSSEKNPIFALDVAIGVSKILHRQVSIIFLGSGPLENEVKAYAKNHTNYVLASFKGFVQQSELPQMYSLAKVFLFPSSWDPWGVVANEACASGQAVMISPHAGAANELIVDDNNGYILPLDLASWVEKASQLLNDGKLLKFFSENSLQNVKAFSYDAAAKGVINAVDFAQSKIVHKTIDTIKDHYLK